MAVWHIEVHIYILAIAAIFSCIIISYIVYFSLLVQRLYLFMVGAQDLKIAQLVVDILLNI